MGKYISRLPLKESERIQAKPIHHKIDEALAAKGHKRRRLPDKPEVVRPELRQSYKNRGGSNYRKAYARMVGSE